MARRKATTQAARKTAARTTRAARTTKPKTKSEIVAHLAQVLELPRKKVAQFFTEFANLAYKEAKRGFIIPGIGKLSVVRRKARKGRNPRTGEEIRIPAKRVVRFRISKTAKDAIVGGK